MREGLTGPKPKLFEEYTTSVNRSLDNRKRHPGRKRWKNPTWSIFYEISLNALGNYKWPDKGRTEEPEVFTMTALSRWFE